MKSIPWHPRGQFLSGTDGNADARLHRFEKKLYHPDDLIQPEQVSSAVVSTLLMGREAEVVDIRIRPSKSHIQERYMDTTLQKNVSISGIRDEAPPGYLCRFCGSKLEHVFVDLGMSPLCESFRSLRQLNEMEPFYPLRVYICSECYLVQLPRHVNPDAIFTEYAYFLLFPTPGLRTRRCYVDMMVRRFRLASGSFVVEIASNDGYLLQYFVKGTFRAGNRAGRQCC